MPFYSNTKCLSIHQSNHHLSQTNDSAHPNSNVLASALSVVITIIQSSSRISPLHRCVPATLLLDAMQSTSDMISPTRRFVLTADGKVVNQQMLCNGKSFETGRHRGRGSLSSCCYSSRALFSVLWVGQSISSSYSSASPPHLTSFSCPSFSPSTRPMPLHDNNPTPPSQLNPRSPVYPELQAFFPARLHSSSAAHLQARIDLIQSFPIRLYRHLSLCSLQARPSCKPREGMENASKQRARSHPVFSSPALVFTLHSPHTTASPSVLQATEMEGI